MEWKDQYKHPNWQKKRLEVLEDAEFECQNCGEKNEQLHVHHVRYRKGAMIWEYKDYELEVLCDRCHNELHVSRDSFNKLLVDVPDHSGFEICVHNIAKGFDIGRQYLPVHFVDSLEAAVGYAANNLYNLAAEDIIAFASISPEDITAFIKAYRK